MDKNKNSTDLKLNKLGQICSSLFLPIGGITPFSTIDCPGKISSVFYLQGCHLNCGYCHNVNFKDFKPNSYPVEKYKKFLKERKSFVEAIVFSGGEPFLHFEELLLMANFAEKLDFEIALHTTGSFPQKLEKFIKNIKTSWVGIDLKAPKQHYQQITGTNQNYFNKTVESIKILTKYNIKFEARTTIDNFLIKDDNLKNLLFTYEKLGINTPVLQPIAFEGKQNNKIKHSLKQYIKNSKLNNNVIIK